MIETAAHPDDEFHPPTSDDPYWTETCWFTFTVPERRLSGQLYPFFRPNQGVAGRRRLLLGRQGRPAVELPVRQELLAPADARPAAVRHHACPTASATARSSRSSRYEIALRRSRRRRRCTSTLTFTARRRRRTTSAQSHLDQPGRYDGHDRARTARRSRSTPSASATARGASAPQFGERPRRLTAHNGGYSYATASERRRVPHDHDGLRRGAAGRSTATCSATASGRSSRRPRARSSSATPTTGFPARVRIDGRRRARPRAARRGPLPQPARVPDQPEPVHGQLPHRVDLRRHDRLRRGPRQLERAGIRRF